MKAVDNPPQLYLLSAFNILLVLDCFLAIPRQSDLATNIRCLRRAAHAKGEIVDTVPLWISTSRVYPLAVAKPETATFLPHLR